MCHNNKILILFFACGYANVELEVIFDWSESIRGLLGAGMEILLGKKDFKWVQTEAQRFSRNFVELILDP